jgi:hypothetical protein
MKQNIYISLIVILTVSGVFADKLVDIHGFVSQGFFASSNYNYLSEHSRKGSWEMREVGINFQKDLGNRFRVGMQFLSRDVGVFGNNKIVLDWAYGNAHISEMLNISVGRNKTSFCFYTSTQDYDFLTPFAIMPQAFYGKGSRSLSSSINGIQLTGSFNLKRAGSIDYIAGIGKMDFGEDTDIEQYLINLGISEIKSINTDIVMNPQLIYNTPVDGLSLLASGIYVKNQEFSGARLGTKEAGITIDVNEDDYYFYTGLKYDLSKLLLLFEYRYSYFDVEQYIHEFDFTENITRERHGGYLGALYKPIPLIGVGGYYQMYWNEVNEDALKGAKVHDPSNVSHDGALTLSFNIKNDLVIKLEGHMVYGTAKLSEKMNEDVLDQSGNFDNGDYWQYGIIKATYNF